MKAAIVLSSVALSYALMVVAVPAVVLVLAAQASYLRTVRWWDEGWRAWRALGSSR